MLGYEVRPASPSLSRSLFWSFAACSADWGQWHWRAVMEEWALPQACNISDLVLEQAPKVVCGRLSV